MRSEVGGRGETLTVDSPAMWYSLDEDCSTSRTSPAMRCSLDEDCSTSECDHP